MSDTQHRMQFSYERSEDVETTSRNIPKQGDIVSLVLKGDDLEHLPFVMRKIETFLRQVGFDYVSLAQVSEGNFSQWQYTTGSSAKLTH